MGLVFVNTWLELVLVVLLLLLIVYRFFTKNFNYWQLRGVPARKPVFPFGSMKDLVLGRRPLGLAYDDVYKEFKGERFCGLVVLRRPVLVIRDPELIRRVLISDFNHFVDRDAVDVNPRESIANHLFVLDGDSWRDMRHRLSPAFSSGKLKTMFQLMLKSGNQLGEFLSNIIDDKQNVVNVKEVMAKFTMDVIATCAFGLEINSLVDENTEFYNTGISFFKADFKLLCKNLILGLFPKLGQLLNLHLVNKKMTDMMTEIVKNTTKYREENNVSRNDFVDILIKLKQNKSILDGSEEVSENGYAAKDTQKKGLTLEQMTAEAFVFFTAGFETASSTITFCLYELARNPAVQQHLRREIKEVLNRHDGQLTYEALQEMKYMEQVINETTRMYASLPILNRRCTKTYQVPDSDLVLEKGVRVHIPVYAIHHDPEYYPEPFKFDPERFNPENAKSRHPCVHIPFGTGPRNCIGMRFGLMQTKIGLTTFISDFKVAIAPETPHPIELSPLLIVTQAKKPVYLRVTRRESL